MRKQRGFTIVELLIVIVIIGILAAITIVAYNGITNRAHASAAQADASAVARLLGVANVTNGSYPTDLSTINNGSPMPATDGTTYAYHPGSGNSSYCVTVTNGSNSFKVTDTATSPVAGGCPGDGVNGVAAITNLSVNPSFEATAGVSIYGTASASNPSVGDAYSGTHVLRVTQTGTSGSTYGPWWNATAAASPGQSYYVQLATRSNNPQSRSLRIEWIAAGGGSIVSSVTLQSFTTSSSWQLVGGSAVAPAGVGWIRLTLYGPGNTSDYIDVDGVMITQGTTSYNFADGNSANWIWNGAANSSSSSGPPL